MDDPAIHRTMVLRSSCVGLVVMDGRRPTKMFDVLRGCLRQVDRGRRGARRDGLHLDIVDGASRDRPGIAREAMPCLRLTKGTLRELAAVHRCRDCGHGGGRGRVGGRVTLVAACRHCIGPRCDDEKKGIEGEKGREKLDWNKCPRCWAVWNK